MRILPQKVDYIMDVLKNDAVQLRVRQWQVKNASSCLRTLFWYNGMRTNTKWMINRSTTCFVLFGKEFDAILRLTRFTFQYLRFCQNCDWQKLFCQQANFLVQRTIIISTASLIVTSKMLKRNETMYEPNFCSLESLTWMREERVPIHKIRS